MDASRDDGHDGDDGEEELQHRAAKEAVRKELASIRTAIALEVRASKQACRRTTELFMHDGYVRRLLLEANDLDLEETDDPERDPDHDPDDAFRESMRRLSREHDCRVRRLEATFGGLGGRARKELDGMVGSASAGVRDLLRRACRWHALYARA